MTKFGKATVALLYPATLEAKWLQKTVDNQHEDYSDPFSCLNYQIYVSGRLALIRTPAGTCGEWLCIHDTWYRRLTATAFVWLREQVKVAIKSGRLSEEFSDALEALEWIASNGIRNGVFTQDEIGDHVPVDKWFSWNQGCPAWAEAY